ncbi:hypothetical protein CRYUN_Cryun13aG0070800 [Craigia yunnanensis]
MKAMNKCVMLNRNKDQERSFPLVYFNVLACSYPLCIELVHKEILDMLSHPFLPALYASFQIEDGQVKLQSRLEQEEEAKAALLSRIQRLTIDSCLHKSFTIIKITPTPRSKEETFIWRRRCIMVVGTTPLQSPSEGKSFNSFPRTLHQWWFSL